MTPGLLIRKVRLKKKQLWTGIQTHVHGLPASMQGALGNSCDQTLEAAGKWGFDIKLKYSLGTPEHLKLFSAKDQLFCFWFFISNLLWANASVKYNKK